VGQGELLDHGFFREIVVSTSVAVVVVGGDGTISFVSGPAARALGAGRQVVLEGSRFIDLFVLSEAATITAYLESLRQLPAGQSRWHEATVQVGDGARVIEMDGVNLQSSPHVAGFVLTVSDVTEQRRRDDKLQRAARTDPLTGLLNRAGLGPKLDLLARKSSGAGCVALLDIDNFKLVNDSLGHDVGDEILRRVGLCLGQMLREAAGLARIGGDEFVVVLRDSTAEEAHVCFEKLTAALGSLGLVGGHEVGVSASIGIAETDGAATGGQLLQRADMAMYWAKSGKKGNIWVYCVDDVDWERRHKAELSLIQADLQRAAQEARTDALTGLPNTRAYHEYLLAVDNRERDGALDYAVLFFDADDFHVLNREPGDATGDEVLRLLAEIFSRSCRSGDVVFRKGGEEFVALLPDCTHAEACEVAERTRRAVQSSAIPRGTPGKVLTISVGVACFDARRHAAAANVVAEASDAMTLAKDSGRNCVRCACPPLSMRQEGSVERVGSTRR
jgi:diguanylate cyclase (GGDEF)-like protein/PAS domain S-box-containing protein